MLEKKVERPMETKATHPRLQDKPIEAGLQEKGRRSKRGGRHLVPPPPSSPAATAVMRGNTANDTSPEILLRSALWKSGIRGYRKHLQHLPGRPDVAFPRHRLAVFIHGCFWHRCPKCNILIPRTNTSYWEEKLRRNVERDQRVFGHLEQLGWRTMRLWECEIRESPRLLSYLAY